MGGSTGDTAKGAMIGQSIDPVGGGVLGALAGHHKGTQHSQPHAVMGRYDPHIAQNYAPIAPKAAAVNPYNATGAGAPGKGTPSQAQGPGTAVPQLGGGGAISQPSAAPMKGR